MWRFLCGLLYLALVTASAGEAIAQPDEPVIAFPSNPEVFTNRAVILRDGPNSSDRRLSLHPDGAIRGFENDEIILLFQNDTRDLFIGGHGRAGDIVLLPRQAAPDVPGPGDGSIHLDGRQATQFLGGANVSGRLIMRDRQGRQVIFIAAATGQVELGNNGVPGVLLLNNGDGAVRVRVEGQTGRLSARQIVSTHSANAAQGLDTASFRLSSSNPAISLLDTSGGNTQGWFMQAQAGNFSIHPGTPNGVSAPRLLIGADGSVCIGNCE